MTAEDDMQRRAGAGKAIDATWDKLRPDDPAGQTDIESDEDDLDELAEDGLDRAEPDAEDDDIALNGEVMDDPVDGPTTDGDDPFSRAGNVFRSGRDDL